MLKKSIIISGVMGLIFSVSISSVFNQINPPEEIPIFDTFLMSMIFALSLQSFIEERLYYAR